MTSKSVVKSHPRILGAIKSRGPGRLGGDRSEVQIRVTARGR